MQKKEIKGWRGQITTHKLDGATIATKRAKDASVKGAINKEAWLLIRLKNHGIAFVPQIIDHDDGWFSYQRIDGIHFQDAWKQANPVTKLTLARKLFTAAYQLDQTGIVHGELARPTKNVLVTPSNEIAIIDLERWSLGNTTSKNMKAVAQRMNRIWLLDLSVVKALGTMKLEAVHDQVIKHLEQSQWSRPQIPSHRARWKVAVIGWVLLDLITKRLFYNQWLGRQRRLFTPAFNTGVGWSIPVPMPFVIGISSLICVGLVLMLHRLRIHRRWWVLLLAWALGNLIDRVNLGWVRDFIDFHYRPIFNLADVFVTIGVVLVVWDEVFRKKKSF